MTALLTRAAHHGPPRNREKCQKMAGEDFWEFKASQQTYLLVLRSGETKANRPVARIHQEDRADAKKPVGSRTSCVPRIAARTEHRTEGENVIKEWSRQYEGDPEFEFDLLAIEIGERIVERMELLKMTRTELAAKIGVSKATHQPDPQRTRQSHVEEPCRGGYRIGSRIDVRLKSEERWLPHDVTVQHLALGEPSTFAKFRLTVDAKTSSTPA